MRTTVTLDDDLLEAASAAIGIKERSLVLHEGLRSLIEREAARRLARLGGSAPGLTVPVRRRPPAAPAKRQRAAVRRK
ncbi:MAG: type II toxin-antitoxin system VapB family antitoxin [Burkholderiaceae bacterium]|nr:MAG: type II toxin-antitoxin system VapB family antitoxin [Burkholderiaceae bacterium]MBE7427072.1 type II toxin-antitoxin system VapB family antitoxin [Ideonella sp.]MCC7288525.1 type II toxin-antitoxin system VapB family antitoxin [Burkholderiaceae bacterium]